MAWIAAVRAGWDAADFVTNAAAALSNGGMYPSLYASRAVQFHPMAVNPISSGSPHVRPMGRTCGEPDEIKKNTHPKYITRSFSGRYGIDGGGGLETVSEHTGAAMLAMPMTRTAGCFALCFGCRSLGRTRAARLAWALGGHARRKRAEHVWPL